MMSSGTNLVMTVIGFAVSTMFIVFVCTRLICARIHLSASRRSFHAHPAAARSDLTVLERGLHGLEPVVVASFATTNFGDRRFLSGQDGQCTVCLAEYQEKDVLRILPYCGHSFHMNCVDIWLKQHSTCPICRISLRDSPDRKYAMQPIGSAPARSVHHLAMSDLDPYRYSYTSEGYSPRTTQNQRMEAAQECRPFISEPSGARDAAASLAEINCSNKDSLHFELKGKEAESPSNGYESESIDRNFAV